MTISSQHDTIAAIATAAGEAAVAVVRLSGPEAFAIADRVVSCPPPKPSQRPPRSFLFGRLTDGARTDAGGTCPWIDEVILLLFRAPHSFTRQDVVEFQCHGGTVVAQKVYRTLLENGARPAEPGEFTRRAFLNGRIDLVTAEAVADLIQARTLRAARAAAAQLSGALSRELNGLYDRILRALVEIEARLDFPDDEMPPFTVDCWLPALQHAGRTTARLLATWDQGRMVRQGVVAVIAGCSNVGKSTLLNRLLGHERAIVSSQPGTTRDSIEEPFQHNGIPIRLVDTAGYRATDCRIERDGMARTDKLRRDADILLYMIDASLPVQEADVANLAKASRQHTLLIFNKTDLGHCTQAADYPGFTALSTSLTCDKTGVKKILKGLDKVLGVVEKSDESLLIGERHRVLLQRVQSVLTEAQSLLAEGETMHVPAAVLLRDALAALDECLGKKFDETLLDNIFARFCIGK